MTLSLGCMTLSLGCLGFLPERANSIICRARLLKGIMEQYLVCSPLASVPFLPLQRFLGKTSRPLLQNESCSKPQVTSSPKGNVPIIHYYSKQESELNCHIKKVFGSKLSSPDSLSQVPLEEEQPHTLDPCTEKKEKKKNGSR